MPRKPNPLIFMVKPPMAVAQVIDELRIALGVPRHYSVDRLHITLLLAGDVSRGEAVIMDLVDAATKIRQAPFRVVFDLVASNVLLGSDAMEGALAFQRRLALAVADYAQDPRQVFRPHISLDYGKAVERHHGIDAISWLVEEFLLIESVQGEGRHVVRERFPLSA